MQELLMKTNELPENAARQHHTNLGTQRDYREPANLLVDQNVLGLIKSIDTTTEN